MKTAKLRFLLAWIPVCTCLLILGGCSIVDTFSGLGQARELQQRGEAATAKVLEIWDTGTTINQDPVVGFLLEVRREGREPYQARTKLIISRLQTGLIQPGAILPARVDPNDSSRVSLDIYDLQKKKKERPSK